MKVFSTGHGNKDRASGASFAGEGALTQVTRIDCKRHLQLFASTGTIAGMIPVRFKAIQSFLLLAALSILSGQLQPASAGQINFDDAPNGTIIDNRYPGVTFGCVFCGSGHAFARDMNSFGSTTAATDPNVITLIGPPGSSDTNASSVTSFDGRFGAVTVLFA